MSQAKDLWEKYNPWQSRTSTEYARLANAQDSTDGEVEPSLRRTSTRAHQIFFPNFWFVTTILLSTFIAFQHFSQRTSDVLHLPDRLPTDLKIANSPEIDYEERRFTNAIRAHENGTLYPVFAPGETRYVGLPTPELDEAWHELLRGRYIQFNDDEVATLNKDKILPDLEKMPKSTSILESGFYGGVDMLHSLHCVNAIRKHLDMEYYADKMELPPEMRRMHIDHCVDQLRQAVMCHGDMTPVTIKPVHSHFESSGQAVLYLLGQTERVHTCRKASEIRAWMTKLGNERGYIM